MREPCIISVADAKIDETGCVGEHETVLTIQKRCVKEALDASGLDISDIDGLAVAGLWGMPGPGVMQPNLLTEYLGIKDPKWLDGTNTGGSAFIFHLNHAYLAIKNKICNNILIVYGSTQKSKKERSFLERPAIFSSQFDMIAGLPSPVGAYALAAHRHHYDFGSNSDTLAEIAVAARDWALLNPDAFKKTPISKEDVINARRICTPLGKLDCCLVTDGGGAVVVSNTDRATDFINDPIYIKGFGESSSHSSITYMNNLSVLEVARNSSRRAYDMAGMGPKDIDFAMIYDSFTITVLLSLESLGFCEIGEGKDFVKNNALGPDGHFPINTNGGGLSYCHPGMYSIFTLIEGCRQIWKKCGKRQLNKDINNVLCHGTGGVLSSAATVILSKEGN